LLDIDHERKREEKETRTTDKKIKVKGERKKENPQKEISLSSLHHAECSPVSGIIPTNYKTVVKSVVHWHSISMPPTVQFKKTLTD